MFKRIRAFMLGVREFRMTYTTHYANLDLLDAYDAGRALANILTLHRFDPQ